MRERGTEADIYRYIKIYKYAYMQRGIQGYI